MYSHHRQRSTGRSRNTLPVKKNKESKERNKTMNTANTKIRQKKDNQTLKIKFYEISELFHRGGNLSTNLGTYDKQAFERKFVLI